jgi:hypothetical protein
MGVRRGKCVIGEVEQLAGPQKKDIAAAETRHEQMPAVYDGRHRAQARFLV